MSTPAAMLRISDDLSAIAGAEHIRIAEEIIVAEPENAQAVAQVIRYANQHKMTIGFRGGATKHQWVRGEAPQIYISLSRLNRLLEHPWQDLTCTVQAGCTWEALQHALATHGQFVALDPVFPDRATVGGVLATNDSGPLRQRYGSLRDLVIGMTLVLADGTIAKSGGKVVKNVAGYDLCKLMIGSYGTLAAVTEVTFRLHPIPQHAQSFTITAKNAACLAPLIASIRSSHLLTQSLQVRRSSSQCSLDVCLSAHPSAKQPEVLSRLVHDSALEMREASAGIWKTRESLFLENATVLRVATLPAELCRYLDGLQSSSVGVEIESISQAIGLHDVALRGSREEVVTFVRKLRSLASDVTVSVVKGEVAKDVGAYEISAPVLSLMQAVKRQFDPNNILNPGRLFAGS